ncbi:MAG: thioester domain-containing protein, partial [Vagococcus fluvialis]
MNKKKRQAISLVGVLTVMIAFFITPITALAASVSYEKVADYVSTWTIASLGGVHWTDEGVHMIKADNQPAFCIEHGVLLNGGSGFEPSELNSAEKERLSLISYYGYQSNPTVENYGITQNIIWEEFGDTLLSTQLPNYASRKNDILAKVTRHQTKPSFMNQTVELNAGESVTLTDTNNVLPNYGHLVENSANLQIEKNGNSLKLTATNNSKETGKLQYSMVSKDQVGQSFIYKKPGEQTIATFKLSNAGEMNLNIKVNLNGNVKLKKVDEDTGKAVPNTKM